MYAFTALAYLKVPMILEFIQGPLKVGSAASVHGRVRKSAMERKASEGWRLTESARGKQRGKDNGTSDERNEEQIEN